jgi:hypothetical protein
MEHHDHALVPEAAAKEPESPESKGEELFAK